MEQNQTTLCRRQSFTDTQQELKEFLLNYNSNVNMERVPLALLQVNYLIDCLVTTG